jgi:nucleoside-diphosphate-sugar epimerase
MQKILITGATGFVGRQILKALSKMDCSIKIVIRSNERLNLIPEIHSENIEICEIKDLFSADEDALRLIVGNADTIIHAAWYVNPTDYQNSEKNLDCLKGSINLAKVAADCGVSRFVGLGTCFEYDLEHGYVNVESKILPNNLYASTKAALHMTLRNLLFSKGIDFLWLRLFYLYGEYEDANRLYGYLRYKFSRGEKAILKNPDLIRDYMNVKEAGYRIAKASMAKRSGSYNICTGSGISIRKFAENVARECNAKHLLLVVPDEAVKMTHPIIVGVDPLTV